MASTCRSLENGRRPAASDLRASNLAAVWRGYRSAGVQCLVVSGHPDDVDVFSIYGDAVPGAEWYVARLDATDDVLFARLLQAAPDPRPALDCPSRCGT